jgi:2,3-bisphosphoglycerate-independent phosphoglycerate mutase
MEKVAIHAFADGRDTSPTSGLGYIEELERFCSDVGIGKIETLMGRFYGMDRDSRWDRTEAAYRAITMGVTDRQFTSASAEVRAQYETKNTDEFLIPSIRKGYKGIADGDGILFFNFRADRARQLTRALTQHDFTGFKRTAFPTLAGFVCMTPYDETLKLPSAFEKAKVPNTIGKIVSEQGWKQIRIAETEKYAHVTYFFNGGDETTFTGERRVLVPSPREVKTYDLKPEMSAAAVSNELLKELSTGEYHFAVVNFANPDMVGHTGNLRAAIKAVETVDKCLQQIVHWVEKNNAFAILTADHGNCEKMMDDAGRPLTSHTLLPVPFILIDPQRKAAKLASGGKLCDIAPSILALWGVPKPAEMTGKSLVSLL